MAQRLLNAPPVNALIVYLVVGLAVGLLAPLLVGRQTMGFIGTCLVGAIGAFIGGVVGSYDIAVDQFMVLRLTGIIHATLGAILTVALALFAHDPKARPSWTAPTGKKKRWSDGLLSSDHRSFETISKQHQRMP